MAQQFIGHVEIPTIDLERAAEFYNKALGWEFKPFGRGYYLANTRVGMTIGMRKVDKVYAGDTTIFHVHVDNIEAALDEIISAGGKLFREKTVIPVYGWYALFNDSEGNILGLFQSH